MTLAKGSTHGRTNFRAFGEKQKTMMRNMARIKAENAKREAERADSLKGAGVAQ